MYGGKFHFRQAYDAHPSAESVRQVPVAAETCLYTNHSSPDFQQHVLPTNKEGKAMGTARAAVSRHFQSRGGNNVPRAKFATDDVAKDQAEVLRKAGYADLKAGAKQLARDTGNSERACRNHLAGINAMNLADFFNACRAIPELRAWGAYMIGLEKSHSPLLQAKLNELAMLVREHGDQLFGGEE